MPCKQTSSLTSLTQFLIENHWGPAEDTEKFLAACCNSATLWYMHAQRPVETERARKCSPIQLWNALSIPMDSSVIHYSTNEQSDHFYFHISRPSMSWNHFKKRCSQRKGHGWHFPSAQHIWAFFTISKQRLCTGSVYRPYHSRNWDSGWAALQGVQTAAAFNLALSCSPLWDTPKQERERAVAVYLENMCNIRYTVWCCGWIRGEVFSMN